MQEKRRNLLIGLFVLVGLGVLGTLIVLFGVGPEQFLGGTGYPLYIKFDSASGIQPGNQITLGGIRIGQVDAVHFVDTTRFDAGVQVRATIDNDIKLPDGSRAIGSEPGLGYGRPPIQIIPGPATQPPLAPNAVLPGEMRGAIDSIVPEHVMRTFDKVATRVDEAAEALIPVLRDLHEIMAERSTTEVDRVGGPSGNLYTAVIRLDSSLKHFNDVLGDPAVKSQVREAVANFHQVSVDGKTLAANLRASSEEASEAVREARALISETQGTVKQLGTELSVVCRDASGVFERSSQLLDTLNEVVEPIRRGEGTIGRLVRDTKLYEALVLTAERLAQAVEEFRLLVKDWQQGKIKVGF